MKKVSVLATTLFIFLSFLPLQGMEEIVSAEQSDVHEYPEGFALGFEIETNVFKIKSLPRHSQELVLIAYFNHDEKERNQNELWHFTSDTLDKTFDTETLEPYYSNIELKTIGGIKNKERWSVAITQVQRTLKKLQEEVVVNPEFSAYRKGVIFPELGFPYTWVNSNYNAHPEIQLARPNKTEDQRLGALRPQTTIQTPLEFIPYFFRVYGTKYRRKPLTDILDHETWNQWKESIHDPKARGFACLFIYYVKQLFVYEEGEEATAEQPGPKSKLSLMSRIPFSDMWDSLSTEAQGELIPYLEHIKTEYGHRIIIPYYTYKARAVVIRKQISDSSRKILNQYLGRETLSPLRNPKEPRIMLKEWIDSIVFQEKRREGRDLVSPPMIDSGSYSMGLLRASASNNNALLEVRCHPKTARGADAVNIDNLDNFLREEEDIMLNAVNNE